MTIEITMPKLSDTMQEGTILRWRIKEGDRVSRGDIIAEVETDKAAMEMEAFEDGVVSSLPVEEGATVPVGTLIAVFDGDGKEAEAGRGKEGGAKKAAPKAEEAKKPEKVEEPAPKAVPESAKQVKEGKEEKRIQKEGEAGEAAQAGGEISEAEAAGESAGTGRKEPAPSPGRGVSASPVARRLALEKGLDLSRIRGTGPGGRIVLADVEGARQARRVPEGKAPGRPEPGGAAKPAGKSVRIRRLVARKMIESWQNIPHFFVTVAVDMTDVIRFRKDLDASINDFIVAATARSLREHPWVNSLWLEDEPVEQQQINISLAVATERGLYNPVVRDCGHLSIQEISERTRELADRAHRGKLVQDDLEGGTFTISNMGMLGVEAFSAIITPPQAAVLAVGTVKGEVVVDEQGEPGIAPMLRLTLSADHRILDGADAAEFLGTLKSYLEAPVTLVTCDYAKGKE